jgi:hypothetical protein
MRVETDRLVLRTKPTESGTSITTPGNLSEWVADWVPRSTVCGSWSPGISPTGNIQCVSGAATTGDPGALPGGRSRQLERF